MRRQTCSAGGLLAGGVVQEEAVVVFDVGHGSGEVCGGKSTQAEKLALPRSLLAGDSDNEVDGGGQFVSFHHEVCSAHGGADAHGNDFLGIAHMADAFDGGTCVSAIPADGHAAENADHSDDDEHLNERKPLRRAFPRCEVPQVAMRGR